jgi:azurin
MRSSAIVCFLVIASAVVQPPAVAQTRKVTAPGITTPAKAKAADPVRVFGIVASEDMKYDVTTITVRRGESITVRLTAKGTLPKMAMAHNFVVLKLGTDILKLLKDGAAFRATDFIPPTMMDAVIARTPLAGPGESVQVTFTAPAKPGRYPFICTFAGHYQGGMKGTLVVR